MSIVLPTNRLSDFNSRNQAIGTYSRCMDLLAYRISERRRFQQATFSVSRPHYARVCDSIHPFTKRPRSKASAEEAVAATSIRHARQFAIAKHFLHARWLVNGGYYHSKRRLNRTTARRWTQARYILLLSFDSSSSSYSVFML